MKYYRNNQAQCVICVDDNGTHTVATFDPSTQQVVYSTVTADDPRVVGAVGEGSQFPLTQIDQQSYEAFGFAWRYGTHHGRSVIVLDDRLFTQDYIVRNRAMDDLYNDGKPYDDIFEQLGTVSTLPSLPYPAHQPSASRISIEDALRIAIDAHEGDSDLDGLPVILHPLTVGLAGRNRQEMIAGFLHDVVEDTENTFDDLLARGVDHEIVNSLRLLTYDKQAMSYAEYIERIATSRDPIALHVKLNDLTHNLQRGRAGGHWQQVAKHEPALQRIQEALQSYYNEK